MVPSAVPALACHLQMSWEALLPQGSWTSVPQGQVVLLQVDDAGQKQVLVPPHVHRDLLFPSLPWSSSISQSCLCRLRYILCSSLWIFERGSLLQVLGYPESRDDVSMRPGSQSLAPVMEGDRDVVLCTQDGKQSLRTFCSGQGDPAMQELGGDAGEGLWDWSVLSRIPVAVIWLLFLFCILFWWKRKVTPGSCF